MLEDDEVLRAPRGREHDEAGEDEQQPDQEKDRVDGRRNEHDETLDSRSVPEYTISTEITDIDRDLVFRFLHDDAYWSSGLPRDIFERSLTGSLCFSAFDGTPGRGGRQVGFARVVTDRATFAWLCDVFVVAQHRGHGVARALMNAVMAHPDLAAVRNFMLATRDAHGLYARYGFELLAEPARWMAIRRPYQKAQLR